MMRLALSSRDAVVYVRDADEARQAAATPSEDSGCAIRPNRKMRVLYSLPLLALAALAVRRARR